jgi:hypothetical protein
MEITKEDLRIEENTEVFNSWQYKGLLGVWCLTDGSTKVEIFLSEDEENKTCVAISNDYSLVTEDITKEEFFEKSLKLLNGATPEELGLRLVEDII